MDLDLCFKYIEDWNKHKAKNSYQMFFSWLCSEVGIDIREESFDLKYMVKQFHQAKLGLSEDS